MSQRKPWDAYFIGADPDPTRWALHTDLACPCCSSPVWERLDGEDFRFSCVNYWRDEQGPEHCWGLALPEAALKRPDQQLELF